MKKEKRIYCKYCGAKLKKDPCGRYCPTHNCTWSQNQRGVDEKN